MQRQLRFSNAAGRTIKRTTEGSNGQYAIQFTDDTFIVLTPVYCGHAKIETDDPIDCMAFGAMHLEAAGVITTQERLAIDEEEKVMRERIDRRDYERLKKQFGDKG